MRYIVKETSNLFPFKINEFYSRPGRQQDTQWLIVLLN